MKEYRVEWTIDVSAESPRDAAEKALAIQRDVCSFAQVFSVKEFDSEEDAVVDVDLCDDGEDWSIDEDAQEGEEAGP